jgi:hypothetical protein
MDFNRPKSLIPTVTENGMVQSRIPPSAIVGVVRHGGCLREKAKTQTSTEGDSLNASSRGRREAPADILVNPVIAAGLAKALQGTPTERTSAFKS